MYVRLATLICFIAKSTRPCTCRLSSPQIFISHWSRKNTANSYFSSSKMASYASWILYKDLGAILEELNKPEYEACEEVPKLLKIFKEAQAQSDTVKNPKKHPLIILEGLDGSGKSAMSRRLAKKIGAERWLTPPESIRHFRNFFDYHPTLRTAYYSLGNYLAALEVSNILNKKPVVMDRYWHSTTAYALAQKVANDPDKKSLPPLDDDIYTWPSDLLKPDIVLLLDVSEEIRLERHSRRGADAFTAQERLLNNDTKFRQDVLQAYKSMRKPGVVLVNGDGTHEETLQNLMKELNTVLL